MTAPIRQHIPLPVGVDGASGRRMSAGPGQDHARAAAGILTAKPRQAEPRQAGHRPMSGAAAVPDGPVDQASAGPFGALCDAVAAGAGGPGVLSAEVAVHGDVAVVRLRGELCASVLHSYLRGIWWQAGAGSVVDLAELAFIDCACLGVLVRHCKQIRGQGGSFALAGPQPAVRAVLAATGLLTWFEVHDTVTGAVADAGTQRSPVLAATASARP